MREYPLYTLTTPSFDSQLRENFRTNADGLNLKNVKTKKNTREKR